MRSRSTAAGSLRLATIAGLSIALSSAVCPQQPATLVLSGDEILTQGPFTVDETGLRATVVPLTLQIRGAVSSTLDWPVTGTIAAAVRDLDEAVVSTGHADVAGTGHSFPLALTLTPGLVVSSEADLARYVLHVEIDINGHVLRLRRSLYAAVARADLDLRLPALLSQGQPFPVFAATPSREPPSRIDLSLESDDTPGSLALGSIELAADGTAARLIPLPDDAPAGAKLVLNLASSEHRQTLPTSVTVSPHQRVDLLLPGPSAAPGDRLPVVALVRSMVSGAASDLGGHCCLEDPATGLSLTCHPVVTDPAGVASTAFTLARDLEEGALTVGCRFGEAAGEAPIAVAEQPSVPGLILDLRAASLPDGRGVGGELTILGVQAGRRFHAELRLGDRTGPLVGEIDSAISTSVVPFSFPIPDLAALAAERWTLIAGIEDAIGRRSAVSTALYALAQPASVEIVPPRVVTAARPFAVAIIVRDETGHPLISSGSLHLDGAAIPFATDDTGLTAVEGLQVEAGEVELVATVSLAGGEESAGVALLTVLPRGSPSLQLEVPPLLPTGGLMPVALLTGEGTTPLGAWTSAGGVTLDARLGHWSDSQIWGDPSTPIVMVNAVAAQAAGELILASEPVLGPPAPVALVLTPGDSGDTRIELRGRGRVAESATLVIRGAPPTLAPAEGAAIETIRTQVADATSDDLRRAFVRTAAWQDDAVAATYTTETEAVARGIAQAKVTADLNAIADDVAARIDRDDLSVAELDEWVGRRADTYYDPWGKPYRFSVHDGRLWLQSWGLDEVEATIDDVLASLYLHSVFAPAQSPVPRELRSPSWAAAIRPDPLMVIRGAAASGYASHGIPLEVTAQTDDGVRVTARQEASATGRLQVAAPRRFACRRGDRFTLPIDVIAPPLTPVAVAAVASDADAVDADLQPAEVVSSEAGLARFWLHARVLANRSSHLSVEVTAGPQLRRHTIELEVQRREVDAVVLGAEARALHPATELMVRVPAAASTERRAPTLHARLFAGPRELAADTRSRVESLSTASLGGAAAVARAASGGAEPDTALLDEALAQLHRHQSPTGGYTPLDATAPRTEATLDAMEALVATGRGIGAEMPQIERAIAFLVDRVDADGAVAPSTQTGDNVARRRARLRATARFLRVVSAVAPQASAGAEARRFLEENGSGADDARTLAQVVLGLVSAGSTASSLSLVQSLLEHAVSEDGAGASGLFFPGLPGDGESSTVHATALAAQALAATSTAPEILSGAITFLAASAHPLLPPLPPRTLSEWLDALDTRSTATVPAAATLRLQDGTSIDLHSEEGTRTVSASLDDTGGQSLEVTAHTAGIVLLWIEGPRGSARTEGGQFTLEGPPVVELTVGEGLELPLSYERTSGVVVIEGRSAPCLDVALHIGGRVYTPVERGRVEAAVPGEFLEEGARLWIAATCPAHLTFPPLRLSAAETPWRISTTAPRLVSISPQQ